MTSDAIFYITTVLVSVFWPRPNILSKNPIFFLKKGHVESYVEGRVLGHERTSEEIRQSRAGLQKASLTHFSDCDFIREDITVHHKGYELWYISGYERVS